MKTKLVVVGSGPAGYAAALYAARAELAPLVFAGPEPGGQLVKTTEVENYPGFSGGILGPKLMEEMQSQAEKFGAVVKFESVESIDTSKRPFAIKTDSDSYEVESVIIATGSKSRMLGVGEEEFLGKGLSTCAVCDAAFFRGKVAYVVGGGDAAMEEARALAKFVESVTIVVRRDEFRASKIMQKRILDNSDKIKVIWSSKVVGVEGKDRLERIVIEGKDGKRETLQAEGLFLAIGHLPMTGFLKDSGVKLDDKGYVVTGLGLSEDGLRLAQERIKDGLVEYPTMTSVEGIFAGGDAVDFRYRQAVTAAGFGVAAVLDAQMWLEEEYEL